jgi:hypothetical protein
MVGIVKISKALLDRFGYELVTTNALQAIRSILPACYSPISLLSLKKQDTLVYLTAGIATNQACLALAVASYTG